MLSEKPAYRRCDAPQDPTREAQVQEFPVVPGQCVPGEIRARPRRIWLRQVSAHTHAHKQKKKYDWTSYLVNQYISCD